MRRLIFLSLGVLELAVAATLVVFSFQLPDTSEIDQSVGRVAGVTHRTGDHVRLLGKQVHELRRPELQQLADRLQAETHTVTATVRAQKVDFNTVKSLGDALGDISNGLDGLAEVLDEKSVGKLGEGLNATASYLDEKVAVSAAQAADDLEKATEGFKADSRMLGELLREAPPDLKAARAVHDSLDRFGEGLSKLSGSLKAQRLDTMREGFRGLESALTTGAAQVERLAGYTYPVVTMNRWKPTVEQRQFWPEGGEIAEGMRKASAGAAAAGKELDAMAMDLPKLRDSLDEGRKMTEKVRDGLATALKHQDKLETLLKDVPGHTARLAEALPAIGTDLSRVLRDTQRLKEVAASLRQAQQGLDAVLSKWPELRRTLAHSATVLRGMQRQLAQTLEHRQEYEAALRQTVLLTDTFATVLPLFTEQMDHQLGDQEQALEDLGQNIDEVGASLPALGQTANRMTQTARLLAWLMAAIAGLHGAYLAASVRLGRRYSM